MLDVARLIMRADEVTGAGKSIWNLHRQADAASTLIGSIDDVAETVVGNARPGQPIGIFQHADGVELVPLDARRRAVAMVGPHEYPPIGGLTLRVESVHATEGSQLLGLTSMTSQGRMGRVYAEGVVPNSAAFG